MDTLQLIADARIIPTLKIARADDAPPIFAALCSGGINAALVSFRSPEAPAMLRQASRLFPDFLLGADGVSIPSEAENAIQCGARIIASYGFSPDISDTCKEKDAFYLPFCIAPTELLCHSARDGKAVGIFSPEHYRALSTVDALADAFPRLPLVAGNIPLDRLGTYLSHSQVIACTCPDLAVGSLDEIIAQCRKAALLATLG